MEVEVTWVYPALPLQPVNTAAGYRQIGIRLWRTDSLVWSPLKWCTPAAVFRVHPQAHCLVLVIGRKLNPSAQLCDVVIGAGFYTCPLSVVPEQKASRLEIRDQFCLEHLPQVVLNFQPRKLLPNRLVPPLPAYMVMRALVKAKRPPEPQQPRRPLLDTEKNAIPFMSQFDRMMRDCITTPWGERIRVIDWMQQMTREDIIVRTHPVYFVNLLDWYLSNRGVPIERFLDKPERYPDVLQFVCGHRVWVYPYCADECIDGKRKFHPCDVWASGRWIESALRATDCEDNTVDIIATFYALQKCRAEDVIVTQNDRAQKRSRLLIHALAGLARKYTAIAADTVLVEESGPVLHLYVKLMPTRQWKRLCAGKRPKASNTDLPILLVDSTRRSWTPQTELPQHHTSLVELLYRYLRTSICDCGSCEACAVGALGDLFTWATPTSVWQRVSKGLYHTDLRYYDPRKGRVYMPYITTNILSRDDRPSGILRFGVPSLALEGFSWMHDEVPAWAVSESAYRLPTTGKGMRSAPVTIADITETLEQPESREGSSKDEEVKTKKCVPALPNVEYDFKKNMLVRRVKHRQYELKNVCTALPVYIRTTDAHRCNRVSEQQNGPCPRATAECLENICNGAVNVLYIDILYIQEPEQYVYALMTTLTPRS